MGVGEGKLMKNFFLSFFRFSISILKLKKKTLIDGTKEISVKSFLSHKLEKRLEILLRCI